MDSYVGDYLIRTFFFLRTLVQPIAPLQGNLSIKSQQINELKLLVVVSEHVPQGELAIAHHAFRSKVPPFLLLGVGEVVSAGAVAGLERRFLEFRDGGGGRVSESSCIFRIVRGSVEEVLYDGLWCFEGLDHFLVMAPALDGRSGADVFAEHAIEMIFSFFQGVRVDEVEEVPEKLHILGIFLLGPVQTIEPSLLLPVVLEPISTFSRFEEPRPDKAGGRGWESPLEGGGVGRG